jgi:HTH domain.
VNTSQKIIKYIQENGQVTGSELVDYLSITDRAVRKQLKYLLDNSRLVKTGNHQKSITLYHPKQAQSKKAKINLVLLIKLPKN